MSKLTAFGSAGRIGVKIAIVGAATLGGSALVSSSVFASLTAVATQAQGIQTGTLKLVQSSNVTSGMTGGITTSIPAMTPGDTVNRYIQVDNTGTLAASGITLKAATTGSILATDATNGIHVSLTGCSTAWVAATCSGSVSVLASTALSALTTGVALSNASAVLAASGHLYLQMAISLPNSSEVTTNGTLPGSTIQGISETVTWTFTTTQVTGSTTNS